MTSHINSTYPKTPSQPSVTIPLGNQPWGAGRSLQGHSFASIISSSLTTQSNKVDRIVNDEKEEKKLLLPLSSSSPAPLKKTTKHITHKTNPQTHFSEEQYQAYWGPLEKQIQSHRLPTLKELSELIHTGAKNHKQNEGGAPLPKNLLLAALADVFDKIVKSSPLEQTNPKYLGINLSRLLYGFRSIESSRDSDLLLDKVTKHLSSSKLDCQNIGSSIYGLQRMSNTPAIANLLHVISTLMEKVKLDSQAVSNILFGMQNLQSCEETDAILSAIVKQLPDIEECNDQAIANSLYGLKSKKHTPAVEAFLLALADKMMEKGTYDSQHIGNSLYGLQKYSMTAGVKAILEKLVLKIPVNSPLNPQAIVNGFYGLQNMEDAPIVEKVVQRLGKHLTHGVILSSHEIRLAFYGFKSTTNCPASVMLALAEKVTKIDRLSAEELSASFIGLQKMQNSPAIEKVVEALCKKIPGATEFGSQELCNIVLGLQNMSNSPSVTSVMTAVTQQIRGVKELSMLAISLILYGLKGMTNSPAVDSLLGILSEKMPKDDFFTGHALSSCLYGMQNMTFTDHVEKLLGALLIKYSKSSPFTPHEISKSFFGLKHLGNQHQIVNEHLRELANQVRLVENLTGESVSCAFLGMRNMKLTSSLDQALEAFIPKIEAIEKFELREIAHSLMGISHLQINNNVHLILKTFRIQMQKYVQAHPSNQKHADFVVVAEIINALMPLSSSSKDTLQIIDLLFDLIPKEMRSVKNDLAKLVICLLESTNTLKNSERVLDLHHLSHSLASFYVERILQTSSGTLILVHGAGLHSSIINRKVMKETIGKLISKNHQWQIIKEDIGNTTIRKRT